MAATRESTDGRAASPERLPRALDFERRPAVELALLLTLTLLAAALRLYRLGDWSLWGDEAFTLRFAGDGFRVPLSTALIYALTRALGVSEWSARLGPALIGAATVPLLYFPARRAFGKPAALVSSLLLACSPWHLYWSQNARFYSTLLLLFSLALLTFYLALEEDRPWLMAASLVLLGLAANERLLALFFVPAAAGYVGLLWLLRFERPRGLRARSLAIYAVPGALGLAFFAGPYLLSLDRWVVNFGSVNNTPAWVVAGTLYYIGPALACLAGFGAAHELGQRRRAALLLSLAAGLPVLALAALAPFQYTANRYAFVGLTSWIWLASLAIVGLFRQGRGAGRLLAAGVLAAALAGALADDFLYFQYQNGNREDARGAYAFVAAQRGPNDVVVGADWALGQFYLQGPVQALAGYDFAAIPPGTERVWIVADMNTARTAPAQQAWIEANAREAANFDVHAYARTFLMRVYVYHVPDP